METLSPLAGKAAPREMLVDLNKLERFLHSFPFFTTPYRLCAENSVHKLATNLWRCILGAVDHDRHRAS